MKVGYGLLAACALALPGCANTSYTAPTPSGGSAAAEGAAYCEIVPTNPEDLEQWNELCQPSAR